jgi:E3 ubiquitin-protein ligase HERC2
MVDYLGKKAADQASQVHPGVTCDGCQTCPIQGIRYKCSVCLDFGFCDKCEAEKVHGHPFLKIRKSDHAPAFINC